MLTKLTDDYMGKVSRHNKVTIGEYYRQCQHRPKNSTADLRWATMQVTESVVSAKVVHVKGNLITTFNSELFRLSR